MQDQEKNDLPNRQYHYMGWIIKKVYDQINQHDLFNDALEVFGDYPSENSLKKKLRKTIPQLVKSNTKESLFPAFSQKYSSTQAKQILNEQSDSVSRSQTQIVLLLNKIKIEIKQKFQRYLKIEENMIKQKFCECHPHARSEKYKVDNLFIFVYEFFLGEQESEFEMKRVPQTKIIKKGKKRRKQRRVEFDYSDSSPYINNFQEVQQSKHRKRGLLCETPQSVQG